MLSRVTTSLWSLVPLELLLRARPGAAWAKDEGKGCICSTKVCRAILAKDPFLCSKILQPFFNIIPRLSEDAECSQSKPARKLLGF